MNRYAAVNACAHYKRMAAPIGLAIVVATVGQIIAGGL